MRGNDAASLPIRSAKPHSTFPDSASPQNLYFRYLGSRILNHGRPDSIHSYGDHCSATLDAALTYGCLQPERGDRAGTAIRPEERAWLDGIRTLASEWLAAVEADDRPWMVRAVTRIQRHDDRSDGLIDLVVIEPPDRRR
jgi:hypothetical protein